MPLIYSIKKSYKLKKISKILSKRNANSLTMLLQIPYIGVNIGETIR